MKWKSNVIKVKGILIVILLASEFYYFIRVFFDFPGKVFHLYHYSEDSFYLWFIKFRYSSTLFYICKHFASCEFAHSDCYSFCWICCILKQTSINFKQKLTMSRNIDVSSLPHYNRIIKAICLVKKLCIIYVSDSSFSSDCLDVLCIVLYAFLKSTFTQFSCVWILESSVLSMTLIRKNDININDRGIFLYSIRLTI